MRLTRWRTAGLGALVLGLALVTAPVSAQAPQAQEDRLGQLEREVAALKAELATMKGDGAAPAVAGDRVAELERQVEVLAQEIETLRVGEAAASADTSSYGFGPAASKIYRTERGLSIGGYGELLYQNFDRERDNGTASGKTDTVDVLRGVVYFGYKFSDRWLLNTEIEYEHAGSEVAVEFAYVDHLWRPAANFRGGLVLIPMGFLNELHEPTVFLGARRPDVEQVLLPSTWREVGAGLFGDLGPFTYRTYLVTGLRGAGFTAAGLRGGRQKGNQAKAEDFAWTGRLDFTGIPGVLIGTSAYLGDSGQDLGPAVGTQIVEGHLEWRWRGLEARALGVQASLDDVAALNRALNLTGTQSVGEKLRGGYLQVGYDVLAGRGAQSLTPYARWESYNTQDEVPSGFRANPANDVESLTLGVAWKPMDQLTFKVDHQNYDNAAGTGVDQFNVLLGWIF